MTIAPLVVLLAGGLHCLLAAASAGRTEPASTARLLVASMTATALAATWVLAQPLAAGMLAVSNGPLGEWCRHFVARAEPPLLLGAAATAVLGVGAARVGRVLGREWRSRRMIPPGPPLSIIDHDDAIAVTTGGRRGRIIVSSTLLRDLSPNERRAVIAHERAHLRHRHDRLLMLSAIAATVVPPLRPLESLVSRNLERWADESAAAEVGDRSAVARALEALAPPPSGALRINGASIAASDIQFRLDSLAEPAAWSSRRWRWLTAFTGRLALVLALLAATGVAFQAHQLVEILTHNVR